MTHSNKLPQRKPSLLRRPTLSRSGYFTPANNACPTAPQSPKSPLSQLERRHNGLRRFLGMAREPEAQHPVLTPPSSTRAMAISPAIIPRFTKAFVDALNVTQLSDFFLLILYYEVVELPKPPKAWYGHIDTMEMRGWIGLGEFLAKSQEAGTGYGYDLIVLDSICDRIRLSRPTVHTLLIHLADPNKMKHSILASDVSASQKDDATKIYALETVQSKLHNLHKLTIHLKPRQGSQYEVWQIIILGRLRAFLDLVIVPRIAHLRTGKPLTTVATSEQLPKEVTEGIRMNYLYEAIQQERTVQLECYDIHLGREHRGYQTPQSSSSPVDNDEVERARNHAIVLMAENSELRSQLATAQRDNERLIEANEKLAQKASKLGRLQPVGYIRSTFYDDRLNNASASDDAGQPKSLNARSQHTRPRSVSTGDIEALATALKQGLHTASHHRQNSEILAQKYDDVFSSLQSSLLPTLRLSALPSPATPPPTLDSSSASRPITLGFAPKSGRRSGMIFDRGGMEYLTVAGEGTPTAEESDEDGDEGRTGGYFPVMPTPEGRKRFNLLE
jgi:hypothetical protein